MYDVLKLVKTQSLEKERRKGYTGGQVAAMTYNYANYGDIQKVVLSILLGVDFYRRVRVVDYAYLQCSTLYSIGYSYNNRKITAITLKR
jgi:hypothetical protein